MNDNDKCKILFKNVTKSISLDELELIFEYPRIQGDFEIVLIKEINMDEDKRDIFVQYKSEDSVQALIKAEKILYKKYELIPSLLTSNTPISQEHIVPATYEIRDIYKYPFYLLNLNKDLMGNFEIELSKCNAKIKSIDNDKIEIEKIEKITENEVGKNWHSDMKDCLKRFGENFVCQFEMNNIDETWWPQIRNKAIDFCKNTDRLSLIYRNKPNNYLRIDGESKLIKKIIDDKIFLI
ncbi:hypothetical protein BpHYR1_046649 [Brachionus plicatilis]|uniref:RRM domain-containing protein n=1 Tax=Brachionus plicatilis TaxID=10195 RepID=A0A3M7RW09_BRAPC|nr:hypothetical protein BpHYR1_046649 [Brachionus plicatilis]